MYGYYPINAAKTWLIVKPDGYLSSARQQFAGTGVHITVEGKRRSWSYSWFPLLHRGLCL